MADEVASIKFVISKEASKLFDWGDIEVVEAIQSGDTSELSPRDLRFFVARFMVDEKGQTLPHAQAVRMLRKVPNDQVKDVLLKFSETASETAIPKASGEPLKSPSEVSSPTPPLSPDGATQ